MMERSFVLGVGLMGVGEGASPVDGGFGKFEGNVEDDDVEGLEYYDEEQETLLQTLYYVLPGLQDRWKSVVLAVCLLLAGIGFFCTSLIYFFRGDWGYGASMLFLTFLCGLPGGETAPCPQIPSVCSRLPRIRLLYRLQSPSTRS